MKDALAGVGAVILLVVVRLLGKTCRYEIHGEDKLPDAPNAHNGGFIMAFWHQNLLPTILAESGRRSFCTMISRSRDGDIISYVVERFGHLPARGSTAKKGRDKGGKEAHDELIERVQSGYPGAVTVDGPTGPKYKVKAGVVSIAEHAGVPVVPYLAIADKYWELPSWDRLRIPKPFSRVRVYYGEPVNIPQGAPRAEYARRRRAIKESLDAQELHFNPSKRGTAG